MRTLNAQQLCEADGSRAAAMSAAASSAEEQGQAWVTKRDFFTSVSLTVGPASVSKALLRVQAAIVARWRVGGPGGIRH